MKNIDTKKVEKLLTGLSNMSSRTDIQDGKGNLDITLFNKTQEVIEVTSKLKEMGVDREWLRTNGFVVGSMILTFK